ncbi:RNA-guided endonuclease TnpB family protein [Halolactibacillus sp. JCM 19043]|uniref:RNA-guided endonuclease TnpB family protein n=1 Tax=Halolactibacillus sp. JCM 19043 TaxID=1460638 RepID=UPI000781D620|nr:RNA-guided endonuclease TnpB family protein [Halolactibacillus sp. JCM 19043]
MYKGIEGKIYPNRAQQRLINQTFGHSRFVWNQMLAMLNTRYDNNPDAKLLSYNALSILLTQLKKEHPWLKEVDAKALQNSVKTLRETFDRFFNKQSNYPRFKSSKHYKKAYKTLERTIRFNANQRYIKLPKLGWVKCSMSLNDINNDNITSVTVIRKSNNNYYISVLVEIENQALPKTEKAVGIDLGLTDLAITSDGVKYPSLYLHRKYKKQLHYWEKRLARRRIQAKKDGKDLRYAKNYQKARIQVAKLHQKMKDTRKDYLHKVTTELVETYDVICIEELKTSNMIKNHNLAQSIASQSWRMFRNMLAYKCLTYGKELIIVNPYKTSQVCSSCGVETGKKPLSVRHFTCPTCHTQHDRDINASKNIKNIGLGMSLSQ